MATEKVVAFFEESGSPVAGLQPSIIARDLEDEILFSAVMNEVGGGWYSYRIENYNKGRTYLITIDGGNSLSDGNRFQYVSNELDSYPNKLDWRSISTWSIDYKQLAKEVWDTNAGNAKEGSYGSLVINIDIEKTKTYCDDLAKKIESIKIPEGLKASDIKKLLDDNDTSKNVINEVKEGIAGLNANLLKIQIKLDDDGGYDIVKQLNDISIEIDNTNTMIKNYGELPNVIRQYKEMAEIIMTHKDMSEKIAMIRLGVKDILSKLKK